MRLGPGGPRLGFGLGRGLLSLFQGRHPQGNRQSGGLGVWVESSMPIHVGKAIQPSGDRAEAVTPTSRATGLARGRPMEAELEFSGLRAWEGGDTGAAGTVASSPASQSSSQRSRFWRLRLTCLWSPSSLSTGRPPTFLLGSLDSGDDKVGSEWGGGRGRSELQTAP